MFKKITNYINDKINDILIDYRENQEIKYNDLLKKYEDMIYFKGEYILPFFSELINNFKLNIENMYKIEKKSEVYYYIVMKNSVAVSDPIQRLYLFKSSLNHFSRIYLKSFKMNLVKQNGRVINISSHIYFKSKEGWKARKDLYVEKFKVESFNDNEINLYLAELEIKVNKSIEVYKIEQFDEFIIKIS